MAAKQYVSLRALSRGVRIRVKNSGGSLVNLKNNADTVVDVNDVYNRKALAHHGAIGQFIVTGANGFTGTTALPTNTAS